ncbi:hypothetical protein AK812_SmicGene22254 [Symbiodinium microadriaticum]|uniref:EF-hand domain-containing protein n=1 Tax=Symbiodinium microadriaticum TaxID=2951 RepID=A0A1Q9DKC2_SYMMI|nr:hypothetical protein AK812_SmicGene22254 [Symbiodinium microadriaticum]
MALCLLIGGFFPDVLFTQFHSVNVHVPANSSNWCFEGASADSMSEAEFEATLKKWELEEASTNFWQQLDVQRSGCITLQQLETGTVVSPSCRMDLWCSPTERGCREVRASRSASHIFGELQGRPMPGKNWPQVGIHPAARLAAAATTPSAAGQEKRRSAVLQASGRHESRGARSLLSGFLCHL